MNRRACSCIKKPLFRKKIFKKIRHIHTDAGNERKENNMHSRIFQISENPISEENYIDESSYYEGFVGRIADYVSDSDVESDLNWLGRSSGLEVDVESKTIIIKSKEKYFARKFKDFKANLKELSKLDINKFTTMESDFMMFHLKTCYENEYGFYMDDDGEYHGLTTLDHWVRISKENVPYYVGATFDYHC